MRSAIPCAVLAVAVLGLAAAGCGGSSSDTKANKAYADSVCTAIGKWEQQIKQIATDFSGGISKASLQSKVAQAEAATRTLASEIRAAPPPNSEQGKAAKQQLDQLTSDVQATVNGAQARWPSSRATPRPRRSPLRSRRSLRRCRASSTTPGPRS